jgi:hypothetical protein
MLEGAELRPPHSPSTLRAESQAAVSCPVVLLQAAAVVTGLDTEQQQLCEASKQCSASSSQLRAELQSADQH